MSGQREREAMASLLLDHVKRNDIVKVEQDFAHFSEDSQWRDIVRCEFLIRELLDTTLLYDMILPRLVSYEICTISPFHYAAFKGHDDILVNFIDHDIPVDMSLASGTSALHLASFGGKMNTVQLLIEVYKADINKQDNYGWSALHYASSEGHKDVVNTLVVLGINVNLRDQDGTSAAFRAQVNGHEDIVDMLCDLEDDLLNVDPAYEGKAPPAPGENLYSVVKHRAKSVKADHSRTPETDGEAGDPAECRAKSERVTSKVRSQTLPKNFVESKTLTIRRIIRKEIEASMTEATESGYMEPSEISRVDGEESDKFALAGVGVNTLRGIMREELGKYHKHILTRSQSVDPISLTEKFQPPPKKYSDYEDIYETVKFLPDIASDEEDTQDDIPEVAPPLPPRNFDMVSGRPVSVFEEPQGTTDESEETLRLVKMPIQSSLDSMALSESIKQIGPILGGDWKKLAYVLPLEGSKRKVDERLVAIEKRHPNNTAKQATMMLAEWKINNGSSVDVDDLVIGLRKCGLSSIIGEVERVSQEFTA